MTVTDHAIDRYLERVGAPSRAAAFAAIAAAERGIATAAAFGARVVRLANGAKLVLDGDTVVTVLSRRAIANGDVTLDRLAAHRARHAARRPSYFSQEPSR